MVEWAHVPGVSENIGGGNGAFGSILVNSGTSKRRLRVSGMSFGGVGEEDENEFIICCCCRAVSSPVIELVS